LDPGLTGFENPDRLAQVNARIRHRRHRRLATVGAACAVAVAILIGYALAPAHRSAPQPVGPTPSPSTSSAAPVRLNLGSFAEYEVGTRKVTTGRVPGKGSLRLTWTWDGKPLRVFANCHAKKDTDFYLSAKLGDLTLPHPPTCADGPTVRGTGPAFVSAEDAARTHLLVGEQAELIVTLAKVERATKTVELPADAWIEVGVGVSVDWADYKFPPRPSTLLTPKGTGFDQPLDVHSDPADPMRPVSFDVVWGARRSMRTFQASPGLLHVSFNGVEVRTLAAWDYLGSADAHFSIGEGTSGLGDHPPARGSHVTVTITPEHVTDPWGLWIGPGDALAKK
jgi:hypothetical protein